MRYTISISNLSAETRKQLRNIQVMSDINFKPKLENIPLARKMLFCTPYVNVIEVYGLLGGKEEAVNSFATFTSYRIFLLSLGTESCPSSFSLGSLDEKMPFRKASIPRRCLTR